MLQLLSYLWAAISIVLFVGVVIGVLVIWNGDERTDVLFKSSDFDRLQ